MPTISFSLTAKQIARIQEATDIYNSTSNEPPISPKRFALMSIKGAVEVTVVGAMELAEQAEADLKAAETAAVLKLRADLEGNA